MPWDDRKVHVSSRMGSVDGGQQYLSARPHDPPALRHVHPVPTDLPSRCLLEHRQLFFLPNRLANALDVVGRSERTGTPLVL